MSSYFFNLEEYYHKCLGCDFKSDKELSNPLCPGCGSKLLPGNLMPYKDLLRNYKKLKKRNIELLECLIKYDRWLSEALELASSPIDKPQD